MPATTWSAIVPLYNNRPYILRAVKSALGQSYPPLEVIVVDDGSTDGGVSRLEGVGEGRLRIVRQKNTGSGAARNTGIKHAHGEWVAFLDADDAWLPNHLETLCRLASDFPDAPLLGAGHIELPTEQTVSADTLENSVCTEKEVDYFMEASNNPGFMSTSSIAVKRSVVEIVGGFGSSRLGEDTEFCAKVALQYQIAVSDRITSIYYRGTGGAMESYAGQEWKTQIHGLRDVSPVLSMLCNHAERNPYIWESKSIRHFVNSSLLQTVKNNVQKGDIKRARRVGALMIWPVQIRFYGWVLCLMTPAVVLRTLVKMYRLTKKTKVLRVS